MYRCGGSAPRLRGASVASCCCCFFFFAGAPSSAALLRLPIGRSARKGWARQARCVRRLLVALLPSKLVLVEYPDSKCSKTPEWPVAYGVP
eukprot:7264168-Prymnesium_polylepis.1